MKMQRLILVLATFGFALDLAIAQPSPEAKDVLIGSTLTPGFDMGVNSSEQRSDWLDRDTEHSWLRMSYPKGQAWGAVFITVGKPTPSPRPFRDQAVRVKHESDSCPR